MKNLVFLLSALILAASVRAAETRSIPELPAQGAFLATPQTGIGTLPAELTALIQGLPPAESIIQQGPSVILHDEAHVLVVPENFSEGAQGVAIPRDGGEAQLVELDQTMADGVQAALKGADVGALHETLGAAFDGVRRRTPVERPAGHQPVDAGQMPRTPKATVKFGAAELPLIAMPHQGDDVSKLWLSAHAQTSAPKGQPALLHASYNFDDMEMAKSIVAKSRAGEKQVMVADYSNWFPERLAQTHHGGKYSPRTEAMQYIIDNLNPNLELYILKGLGDIGINHNKFSIFAGPHGKLLQGGSFNYTGTSQKNHWENVVFTDDAERLAYFEQYFHWLVRRARKYSADLMPEDPKMDPADPIPRPPASKDLVFHGVQFPKASFSPNGGTEEQLVHAGQLVRQSHDILMFSPFPTPDMQKAMEGLRAQKLPVRMISDEGQARNATPLVALYDAGVEIRTIVGPDVVLHGEPFSEHSKQHEKVEIFDGRMPDGMAKMGDSLNISRNALTHNFENTQFWQGLYVAYMQAHFDWLWSIAKPIEKAAIEKLREKIAEWEKGHPKVPTAV